jgi:hypothetical protein
MSKGFVILVQNTIEVDYLRQAYALALSIKVSQQTEKNVSLVTNDVVPDEYKHVFDHIIPIPWFDDTPSRYKAENRWKVYHVTPYDETIVLDADMLFLEDVSLWWEQCKNYDVNYCSRIKNYKLDTVVDTVYRKAFVANQLTSPYNALHYFKKSDVAFEFYKCLEFVCNNWQECYTMFAPQYYEDVLSMDLAVAVAAELSGIRVTDNSSPLEFIHMRPGLQGWVLTPVTWQGAVLSVMSTDGKLTINNIKQSKVFHYIEKDFLTDKMIEKLENAYA